MITVWQATSAVWHTGRGNETPPSWDSGGYGEPLSTRPPRRRRPPVVEQGPETFGEHRELEPEGEAGNDLKHACGLPDAQQLGA